MESPCACQQQQRKLVPQVQQSARAAAHHGGDCEQRQPQLLPRKNRNADKRRGRTGCDSNAQREHAAHVDDEPYAGRLDESGHNLSFDPFGCVDAQGAAAEAEGLHLI